TTRLSVLAGLFVAGQLLSACADSGRGTLDGGDSAAGGAGASGGSINPAAGGDGAGGRTGSGAAQGAGGSGTGAAGSGASQGAGGMVMASGGFTSVICDNASPTLSVEHLDLNKVASLGMPFDT